MRGFGPGRSGPRGVTGLGVPGLGGCLVWGVPGLGGAWSGGVPGGDPPTATAAGGTHPMECILVEYVSTCTHGWCPGTNEPPRETFTT